MLVVPVLKQDGSGVRAVLQLINRKIDFSAKLTDPENSAEQVVPFDDSDTAMSQSIARHVAVKLAEIGCETYIESVPTTGPMADPDFEERRRTIRRIRYRREPRPGAIVPDRRLLASRRKADMAALEKYGEFPGMSIRRDG